eukprot:13858667-Alexandrium_andersonii.AAC.1
MAAECHEAFVRGSIPIIGCAGSSRAYTPAPGIPASMDMDGSEAADAVPVAGAQHAKRLAAPSAMHVCLWGLPAAASRAAS